MPVHVRGRIRHTVLKYVGKGLLPVLTARSRTLLTQAAGSVMNPGSGSIEGRLVQASPVDKTPVPKGNVLSAKQEVGTEGSTLTHSITFPWLGD